MKVSLIAATLALASARYPQIQQDQDQQQVLNTTPEQILREAWDLAFDDSTGQTVTSFSSVLDRFRSQPGQRPATKVRQGKYDTKHTHPSFPNHELRIKDPSKLGVDPGVNQYSGYLDVLEEDKHFFFWLFESRNDPSTDPVILWLNGGPGCSSSTGQFFELGPSFIGPNGTMIHNEDSWNNNATVIFLDQPVNVGYSYSTQRVVDSHAAGDDVYTFLSLLFDAFPQYPTNDFHVTGESYGGHYLPGIGKSILSHPASERNFNLTSLAIGNPITDARYQAEASVAMACGEGGYPSLLSDEECTSLYRMVPRCETLVQNCYDTGATASCVAATMYCERLGEGYLATSRNPYDVSQTCTDENPCYPETNWIEEYLNQDYVKEAVGADVDRFVGCSTEVGVDFFFSGDQSRNFAPDLAFVLDEGVPVLQMSGKLDWICNILGSRRFLPKMQWHGAYEFNKEYMAPWYLDGEIVGWSKNAKGLTYLEVEQAGHMIPHDQPRVASVMINHWIRGGHSFW